MIDLWAVVAVVALVWAAGACVRAIAEELWYRSTH